MSLLERLVMRDDAVAIDTGRLKIEPNSGVPVPAAWLDNNADSLITEILELTGMDAWQYLSFTTGSYKLRKDSEQLFPGICMQFSSLRSGECAACIFNVYLTGARGSINGKPYRGKQFRVGRRSEFYKFWLGTGLKVPGLTRFHDYLGNLKEVLLVGELKKDGAGLPTNRLIRKKLAPMEITFEQIKTALNPHNARIASAQHPHKARTTHPHKDLAQAHAPQGLQPFSTVSLSNCENTYISKCVDMSPDPLVIKSLQEQTVAEWLQDYGDE